MFELVLRIEELNTVMATASLLGEGEVKVWIDGRCAVFAFEANGCSRAFVVGEASIVSREVPERLPEHGVIPIALLLELFRQRGRLFRLTADFRSQCIAVTGLSSTDKPSALSLQTATIAVTQAASA